MRSIGLIDRSGRDRYLWFPAFPYLIVLGHQVAIVILLSCWFVWLKVVTCWIKKYWIRMIFVGKPFKFKGIRLRLNSSRFFWMHSTESADISIAEVMANWLCQWSSPNWSSLRVLFAPFSITPSFSCSPTKKILKSCCRRINSLFFSISFHLRWIWCSMSSRNLPAFWEQLPSFNHFLMVYFA